LISSSGGFSSLLSLYVIGALGPVFGFVAANMQGGFGKNAACGAENLARGVEENVEGAQSRDVALTIRNITLIFCVWKQ
jgi:hypothetical protein